MNEVNRAPSVQVKIRDRPFFGGQIFTVKFGSGDVDYSEIMESFNTVGGYARRRECVNNLLLRYTSLKQPT